MLCQCMSPGMPECSPRCQHCIHGTSQEHEQSVTPSKGDSHNRSSHKTTTTKNKSNRVKKCVKTPLPGTAVENMGRKGGSYLSLTPTDVVAAAVSYTHLTLPTTPYV